MAPQYFFLIWPSPSPIPDFWYCPSEYTITEITEYNLVHKSLREFKYKS